MAKSNTILVMLKSKASHFFLVKKRNPKKQTEKLAFTKYDPVVKKHVEFVEKKMPSSSAK